MSRNTAGRRQFLKLCGATGALGVASLSGCAMTSGSTDASMSYVMGRGLQMTKGAPADGSYPASPSQIEMEMPSGEHMEMEAVTVSTIAPTDDSNNYHFMPHVVWVEPGQTVFWEHYHEEGFSERRTHTVTSFGADGLFMRLIPEGASHFDSGYRAGTHGTGDPTIDERFNRKMVGLVGQEGGFGVEFQQKGVYLYYCQNHHMFRMAGAVVVGEIWGENGEMGEDPVGWEPAMAADIHHLAEQDPLHGDALVHQVEELRGFVHAGRAGGGHGMEGGEMDGEHDE
ncbi:plastocyanin/azurin family copper-binding protein [Haloferax sp. S1W]|uniref:cupredoxin domain-containing protein n=1 Tax=Haloferax sp. S1W TaxID=3377110 RepID=UPI0037C594B2